MSLLKRNPVYPEERYNYSGDKLATYLGVFSKIGLLLMITMGAIIYGFSVQLDVTKMEFFVVLFIVPLVAYLSLRYAMRIEVLTSGLSLIFAMSEGILIGVLLNVFYTVNENSLFVLTVFTTIVVLFIYMLIFLIKPLREQPSVYQGIIGLFLGVAFTLVGSLLLDYFEIQYSYDNLLTIVPLFSFLASIFYTVDFNKIMTIVEADAPKIKEWNLALGLLLTIAWIYIRIIELILLILSKSSKKQQ